MGDEMASVSARDTLDGLEGALQQATPHSGVGSPWGTGGALVARADDSIEDGITEALVAALATEQGNDYCGPRRR